MWPHQLALLQAARTVEASGAPLAALVDRPGAGKTHVLLSLALDRRGTTVVVAPQSILRQWQRAALAFDLDVATIEGYGPVADVLNASEALTASPHDVVLTTSLFYNVLAASVLHGAVHRLIIDEVDSVAGVLKTRLPAATTWLVSATAVAAFIDGAPRAVGGDEAVYRGDARTAPRVCCDAGFLDDCLPLPDPVVHRLVLHDVLVDRVLDSVLSENEMRAVNAMSYGSIRYHATPTEVATSVSGVVRLLLDDVVEAAAKARDALEAARPKLAGLRHLVRSFEDDDGESVDEERGRERRRARDELLRLEVEVVARQALAEKHEQRVAVLRERLAESEHCLVCYGPLYASGAVVVAPCCMNAFCQPCMREWLGRQSSCPMCREPLGSLVELRPAPVPPSPQPHLQLDPEEEGGGEAAVAAAPNKVAALRALMLSGTGARKNVRAIVFSDFDDTFRPVVRMLREAAVAYFEMDGGSPDAIADAQARFHDAPPPVALLVNSSFYGAGMNLQCASDVVFMHRLDGATETQVVGRAQRPGRAGALRVWQLLHQNESRTQ